MTASVRKILWNDWPALAAALGIPIAWAINFAFPHLRAGAAPQPVLAASLSAACAAVLLWRVHRVQRLFAEGCEAMGVLTRLQLIRDRGRLEYAYEVHGRAYKSWCPVHKSRQVADMEEGQALTVIYDPARPQHSTVWDLFAADGR